MHAITEGDFCRPYLVTWHGLYFSVYLHMCWDIFWWKPQTNYVTFTLKDIIHYMQKLLQDRSL